jgi:2-hydroxy-6-oxonona-2,4-dienedioate hydrolase
MYISMSDEQRSRPGLWLSMAGEDFSVQSIDAGGILTRTFLAGREHEQTLLMLHGTGGHIENYSYNLAAHARYFKTYAIDLVGHGWSDKPVIAYEIDDYIAHVLRFLDAVGVDRVHLTGQSLGGWIGARLAARYPDRVGRLVLNTAGGFVMNRDAMQKAQRLGRAASGVQGTREAVRKRLEHLVHDPTCISAEMVDIRYAIYSSPDFAGTMERILCLQDPEIRSRNLLTPEELTKIRARTLVVWTDHDPMAGIEVGREMARLIPDSQFELISGCAHWPQFEQPERFNELQLAFLRAP